MKLSAKWVANGVGIKDVIHYNLMHSETDFHVFHCFNVISPDIGVVFGSYPNSDCCLIIRNMCTTFRWNRSSSLGGDVELSNVLSILLKESGKTRPNRPGRSIRPISFIFCSTKDIHPQICHQVPDFTQLSPFSIYTETRFFPIHSSKPNFGCN